MKHIKKKFLNEFPISEETFNAAMEIPTNSEGGKIFATDASGLTDKKLLKENDVIFFTDKHTGLPTFQLNYNGKIFVVPEPDPVLIYFHSAQVLLKNIEDERKEFARKMSDIENLTHSSIHFFYNFFGNCSNFIIMLYTSLEAFVNRKIPVDYKHTVILKDKTEIYTSEQFIRKFSLDSKIESGLVKLMNRDFAHDYSIKNQHLNDLKNFRNDIVHTKRKIQHITQYDYLYKKALNWDFKAKIHAVRDFINYYEAGLIEDCPCNMEF